MTPPERGPRIRRAALADWELLRDVRLEMLADTPLAYLETYGDAARRSDREWYTRARRHTAPGSVVLVAVVGPSTTDGRERTVGTMSVFVPAGSAPTVASVYVSPAHRGTGVADELLAACEDWSRDRGHGSVRLEVHEDNARAQAFYLRHGYRFTGDWTPYALDRSQRDLEMVKTLDPR
ncbi:GNAT family N-acetyltransferase [Luteimicrobium subarcticum]|uniref:Ribosomal protein S18 acetylase RimI-like enzyme n=1 Tax=Luteimicrobium subarcticum TaxID=620910 RepID=A0A2M8WRN6_9MICO|nr:GNAT family N-acetyltransferase [Luteimicrobium subarcticum]PJI93602.1 ribosomal protein S18 acetylase RimI-like enzyme [Luteimicrobium subarcticum]